MMVLTKLHRVTKFLEFVLLSVFAVLFAIVLIFQFNVNYIWRKKDMTVDTYMYVRGYLVYVDNEGIIHNVYGKVVKTNVNGIVD